MAKTKYGQTWWGQQWLNALNDIDYSNRLPRGKTYANKGAVKDFRIQENNILAKVKGSRPRPYQQILSLPSFSLDEKETILQSIAENAGLIAELLNRQMPKDLNEILESKGIQLFPKDWKSLTMECSCPDWAVPCKHLAAVVYVVANEIDRNPFILFELRGLDLIEELNKRQILTTVLSHEESFQLYDFREERAVALANTGNVNPDAYSQLSFMPFSDSLNKLMRLLDEETLFVTNEEFKPFLQKLYRQTAKILQNKEAVVANKKSEKLLSELSSLTKIELYTNTIGQLEAVFAQNKVNEDPEYFYTGKAKVEQLIQLLELTVVEHLWQYPDSWIALYSVYRFSKQLAESHSFMPRLLKTPEGYRIQWIPADLGAEVRNAMNALVDFCPNNLLIWADKETEEEYYLSTKEQIRSICDIFLRYWIKEAANGIWQNAVGQNKKVWNLFTDDKPVVFNQLGESEIPSSIGLWLKKYYLQHKRFVPFLRIEEERVGFALHLDIEDRESKNSMPIGLAAFLTESDYDSHRIDTLRDIQILAGFLPDIAQLVKSDNNTNKRFLTYSVDGFEKIFFEILPVMELLGIQILLPKSLRRLLFPQLSMSIKKGTNEKGKSFMALQQMLSFDWKVAIGDQLLSPEEFKQLVAQKSGLVKLKDQYVQIDKDTLQKLLKQLESEAKLNGTELLQAALSGRYKGASILVDKQVQKALNDLKKVKEIPIPKGLRASLRPYQLNGYSWLYKNAQLGMGSILADDMGLGKTLQVITLLLKFKEEGIFEKKKALVTVPTTLLTNWQKEIQKFAPELNAAIYHGPQRSIPTEFDILITTYGILRSDQKILAKWNWQIMAIDEAQNIKNVTTLQTKAVKAIKADIYIAMSGTPVENRLSEYWSIMDFSNKGYLGSLSKFTENFANPIQKNNDKVQLENFRLITAPFILRRLKSDKSIIKDLPEKIESDYFTALEPEQAAVYESLVESALQDIAQSDGIARKGMVLTMMMGLKQICNHPYQYLKKGNKIPTASGKANLLFDLLDNIQAQQEKTLIFTQFKEMGKLLAEWVEARYGRAPLFLHGGNSRKQRDDMVEAFQNNRQDSIFILSLKAGGTGLNLTAANHVVHYDLWWNPAVEAQATDRAYRIGQQKNVMVYRLLCEGTLEERIDKMLQDKKELANLTVQTGETWLGDLSNTDLENLVKLGKL